MPDNTNKSILQQSLGRRTRDTASAEALKAAYPPQARAWSRGPILRGCLSEFLYEVETYAQKASSKL